MITVEWNVPVWVTELVLFSLHNDTQLNQHTILSLVEAQLSMLMIMCEKPSFSTKLPNFLIVVPT